jgi:phosphoserine phosphatase RsbU/P
MKIESAKQFKVLVVDDNPDNIQVIGNILKERNLVVGYALNGQQAIELLKYTLDYDLVLLDVDMPLMDGFATCRLIKGDKELMDIPVIFLTAFSETEKIVAGFEAGAHDYITKPFNLNELLVRVNTQLKLKFKTDQVNQMNQLLEQNNINITDSIHYARRIQHALLPSIQILTEILPDSFIFYEPRDIVSGDFYWFRRTGNLLYIVVADGTGHGVPGAFMSILGISMLNEIVKEHILTPSLILAELKRKIVDSLWHQNPELVTNDGIDLAICLLDLSTKIIQYAGASRPLNIIRKNHQSEADSFLEIRADQMSLSTLLKDDKTFINNTLQLEHDDIVYLYSDGFASQFGGEKNHKFSSKRLKELLLKIHGKTLQLQKSMLEDAFNEWKGDLMQTDDILVLGFKIR